MKHDLIGDICHLVGKDGPLHEFDMSYSKIDPENLHYIIEAISENDSLKTFSLKGIQTLNQEDTSYGSLIIKPAYADFKESHLTPGIHAPFTGPDLNAYQPRKPQKYASSIIDNLAKFIELNPNLQHLDLSEMHLGDKILNFTDAIRKSQNLISIHLGHNDIS